MIKTNAFSFCIWMGQILIKVMQKSITGTNIFIIWNKKKNHYSFRFPLVSNWKLILLGVFSYLETFFSLEYWYRKFPSSCTKSTKARLEKIFKKGKKARLGKISEQKGNYTKSV